MKKISVTSQFRIGTACILLLFCSGASWLEYVYLKNLVTRSIYKDTEIYIATAEATRTFVKDVTRPLISALLPPEAFLPEVMSTSFVGREIMSRLKAQLPEFTYKRAASSPINPLNQADRFELEMLQWFSENRHASQWSGIISKGNHAFYARMKAIYAETECLACHGDPQDAPMAMREIYGSGKGGYGYRAGEVVAADTIYIPVDVAFVQIKEKAFWVFIIGIGSLFGLFGLFYLLFNRTVVSRLKGLLDTFGNIAGGGIQHPDLPPLRAGDEIRQLKYEFEKVAAHLKQAHDELKASEVKYRLLFQASQDAIFICDPQRQVIDMNEAGVKLFGLEDGRQFFSRTDFNRLFCSTDAADALWKQVFSLGFVKEYEISMLDHSGNRKEVLITANLRRDETGTACGLEGIVRDVTEKKRIEKYLANAEKMASIGQLAAGVAHEINNPLGVIQCYANLIEKSVTHDSQTFKDVRVIDKHTRNCKSVVEALLNFARVSEALKIPTDIHKCLEEVLSVMERPMQKEGISVKRHFSPHLPLLAVDAQKIKQVFMNLIMNARQAISSKGEIVITTQFQSQDETVLVRFQDNGCGIAQKNLEKIFEPFFTTKAAGKGTGLGLAVSYGIVKQHGGEIEVQSTEGAGSTFSIFLAARESTDQ